MYILACLSPPPCFFDLHILLLDHVATFYPIPYLKIPYELTCVYTVDIVQYHSPLVNSIETSSKANV